MIGDLLHWLGYWSGVTDEAGRGYGFWSGIGSCLTYVGVLAMAWRHLNCHEPRCHRLGHHKVTIDGCEYRTCRAHHPHHGDGQVAAAHRAQR